MSATFECLLKPFFLQRFQTKVFNKVVKAFCNFFTYHNSNSSTYSDTCFLLTELRENIGVDDLDVTADEDGNAALRVGKYISDNIYTDVMANSQGETTINLNIDLTDTVTVRGGAGSNGETSLGIFFERDY